MYYIKKYYRKSLIIIFLIIILLFLFMINHKNKKVEQFDEELIIKEEVTATSETMKFNIKGAVANPGVYEFKQGERVVDAIEKSGGLLENADTSVINLSKNLFDEMVIVIYTNEEVNNMKQNNVIVQYVEKSCDCPKLENDACLVEKDVNSPDNNNNLNISSKVSINTATIEQLQTLNGIGKSKAEAIIKYRSEHGSFKTIEEIMNVSGIGEAIFAKIKDNITI